jgi:NitT/TauT family transport system substrate-binding protein
VDTYPSGKRALLGLLNGEVDITTSADVPIVSNSFDRQDFKILATVGSSDNEPRIVARRDRGIEKPADLLGKHIATQRNSAVHYFMDTFLLKHGLTADDVTISYKMAEELPRALISGEIDAFSMREPFVGQAKSELGDNAVVFEEPGLYFKTCNLVASAQFADKNPTIVDGVLRALIQAESFARDNPMEAIRIVAAELEVDEVDLRAVWPELDFRVSLDQALLGYLEDEARWMIENAMTEKSEIPNYLQLMDWKRLKTLKPEVVTVIE